MAHQRTCSLVWDRLALLLLLLLLLLQSLGQWQQAAGQAWSPHQPAADLAQQLQQQQQ
jgi:hypothetical protein